MPTDSNPDYLLLLAEPFWQMLYSVGLSILPAWGLAHQVAVDHLTRVLVAVVASYILISCGIGSLPHIGPRRGSRYPCA